MTDFRYSSRTDRVKAFMTIVIVALIALLAYLFALAPRVYASEPLRICSGGKNGVYFAASEAIRSMAKTTLPIESVATQGTMDNLERIFLPSEDPRSCDVMIGQPDGPAYLARSTPAGVKKLRQISKLHREYLHALCSKKADLSDLSDLLDDPKMYRVAIGENGSGSWLIWQNFIAQKEAYGEIPVSNEGGVLALSAVAAGDATCALMPSGLNHGTVLEALQIYGDSIELVSAEDKRFDDAKDFKGEPLYEIIEFPKKAYPDSFHANWFYNTKTITWNAGVYVNTDKVATEVMQPLIQAVSRAALLIKAEYGN